VIEKALLFIGIHAKEPYYGLPLIVYDQKRKGWLRREEMLVRVLRRLTLEEIEDQIRRLERSYGTTFDEFEELFLKGSGDQKSVDTYFRWATLVHAYRGYVESGELDCVVEELHDLDSNELRAFTPKRLELLHVLSNLRVDSINELARKVRRNVKNVYQDLKTLQKLGLITLTRRGKRNIVPEVLVEELTFLIE